MIEDIKNLISELDIFKKTIKKLSKQQLEYLEYDLHELEDYRYLQYKIYEKDNSCNTYLYGVYYEIANQLKTVKDRLKEI